MNEIMVLPLFRQGVFLNTKFDKYFAVVLLFVVHSSDSNAYAIFYFSNLCLYLISEGLFFSSINYKFN